MQWYHVLLGVLFLVVCILLILIVLLQKGKGGGLSAAFGGMGSSAFGTRTGDVFTWITIVLTGLFLLLAIGTSLALRPAPDLVNEVRFNPPPGPILDVTMVNLSCSTKGSVIRYTRDGTDPTDTSVAYEKPLRVEPGTTVKARAFRDNWTPSKVTVGAYEKGDPNVVAMPPEGMITTPTVVTPPATMPATAPAAP